MRGDISGQKIDDGKNEPAAEILSPGVQQMQDLRQTTCLYEKIWDVPNLFPGTSIPGGDSRGQEG